MVQDGDMLTTEELKEVLCDLLNNTKFQGSVLFSIRRDGKVYRVQCTLFSIHGTDIRCSRHLFSLNKWQYRDEYIIVIVVLREKNWKKYH